MPHEEKTICFLVGAPRSGTTWVQRLLQSHPRICGGEESHFFTIFGSPIETADKMYDRTNTVRKVGPLCYISKPEFEDIMKDVWYGIFSNLYRENPESVIHLEKTPFHALCLDQIHRIFPSAKVIFLSRDSRAVTASLVHAGQTWGSNWAPNTYRDAAIEWYRHVKSVIDWRHRNPSLPFLQVRYEDALADTEGELSRILRFLFPEAVDLQIKGTLEAFESENKTKRDPQGFSRMRGAEG
jgi:hypothetical protein